MPLHDFRCERGHVTEEFVAQGVNEITCACLLQAQKVFLTVPMGFVQRDICYDSPIDGRPITNKYARQEDLARSGCIEYDPEMKTDHLRRIAQKDSELDRLVDETVDREIAVMPARKREKLEAEMSAGLDAVPERGTANLKPLTVGVNNG